jgi:exopolysaccharide biosynthesis polyprenyl glycosylphosphotransferase
MRFTGGCKSRLKTAENMSSFSPNSRQLGRSGIDCARLIPGDNPSPASGKKKPAKSVRPFSAETARVLSAGINATAPQRTLALLAPSVLQSPGGLRMVRSTAADFALVGLNWLLVGALLVPLRIVFPHVRLFRFDMGAPMALLGIAFLQAALITLIGYAEGLYSGEGGLRRQGKILSKSILWATAVLGIGYGLQGAGWGMGVLFGGAGILHFVALLSWRWHSGKLTGTDVRNVLIVGAGGVGRRISSFLETHPAAGRAVYGFLDNERPLGDGVIGRVHDLARLARTGFVDEVILAAPRDRDVAMEVVREARRLRLDVEIVPELFGCKPEGEIGRVGDLPVICLHAERLPEARLVLKRLVDIAGSALALMALAPLLCAIAGLIKLDSRGPVLYRAQRAGRKGRLFRCYKFRTMVSNADTLKDALRRNNQRSGPIFKIADDPRITRLGRLLRRYSIDELPQLWNVLKGDMSLVGPRPHPADDFAAYGIEHLARLDVTPGITGLWQVTARRDPSFQRGMELDREYIRTWSLGADLRILAKTVVAVVRGSGQ